MHVRQGRRLGECLSKILMGYRHTRASYCFLGVLQSLQMFRYQWVALEKYYVVDQTLFIISDIYGVIFSQLLVKVSFPACGRNCKCPQRGTVSAARRSGRNRTANTARVKEASGFTIGQCFLTFFTCDHTANWTSDQLPFTCIPIPPPPLHLQSHSSNHLLFITIF